MDTNRLKSLPLFESVSDEDLERIAPFVSEVSVSGGKRLVEEGDYAYEFMAIEEGEDMKRLEKTIPSAAAKIRETVEKRRGTNLPETYRRD